MSDYRVLLIGPQSMTSFLRRLIESTDNSLPAIVAETLDEAQQLLPNAAVDVVVIEAPLLERPEGTTAASRLHATFDIPILCYASRADQALSRLASAAWCYGFLCPDAGTSTGLVDATIRAALSRWQRECAKKNDGRRLSTALGSVTDGLIATDAQGLISYVNSPAENLIGRTASTTLGRSLPNVLHLSAPDNRSTQVAIELGREMDLASHELVRPDGTGIPIDGIAKPVFDPKDNFLGTIVLLRPTRQPVWMDAETLRRNRELELLHQATRAFSASLDPEAVVAAMLKEIRRVLGSVGCSTWLVDSGTGQLVCHQAIGPRSNRVLHWRLGTGEGIAGWVARTGRSLVVPDTAQDQRHFKGVDRLTGLSMRSVLAVPLRVRQKTIGTLEVVDTRPHRFTTSDLNLVEALAASAAVAIDNARLHAGVQQTAIDEERRAMARDIHSTLLQSLYSISLAADSALKGLKDVGANGSVANPIKHIRALSAGTLRELKSRLDDISTVVPENCLAETLRQHCEALRDQYSLTILLLAEPEPPLTRLQRDGMYFIAKECLWNVVRHSHATRVNVHLVREHEHLLCQVEDNGIGFDPLRFAQPEAHGLRHMTDRATLLGGRLDISSRPGRGTRVMALIPTCGPGGGDPLEPSFEGSSQTRW